MARQEYLPISPRFATTAIHAFQDPEQWDSLALVPPLVTSTSFQQYAPGEPKKFYYGRCGSPNREILEKTLAKLENGQYGLCFSSGMAAISTVLNLLKSGDHVICAEHIYEGVSNILEKIAPSFGIEFTYASISNLIAALKPNTKLIWMESVSNPTMQIPDMKFVTNFGKSRGALVVIDNTFMTPYFMQPINFGADLVVHSLTKYINGHTDVIMGAVVTSNKVLFERLKSLQISLGAIPSPFDCYQVTRSIKTLSLRMEQHMKNALVIAKFLEIHPKIEGVLYPGLETHPQHALLKRQASGIGGMLSFYVKGGEESARRLLKELKIIKLATSLGGVETVASIPYFMSHGPLPADRKKVLGIRDNMIRLSVGLEGSDDLLDDLKQALAKI